jgi:hypothetical protein
MQHWLRTEGFLFCADPVLEWRVAERARPVLATGSQSDGTDTDYWVIYRVAGFSLLQPSQEPDSDLQTGTLCASAIRTIAGAIFLTLLVASPGVHGVLSVWVEVPRYSLYLEPRIVIRTGGKERSEYPAARSLTLRVPTDFCTSTGVPSPQVARTAAASKSQT